MTSRLDHNLRLFFNTGWVHIDVAFGEALPLC